MWKSKHYRSCASTHPLEGVSQVLARVTLELPPHTMQGDESFEARSKISLRVCRSPAPRHLNDGAGDLQTLNDILDRASNDSSPCKVCGGSSKVTHANTWLTAPEVLLLGFKRERASRQIELCTVFTCLFDDAIMLMCLPEQHAPIQSPRVSLSCVKDALQARSNRRNNGLG